MDQRKFIDEDFITRRHETGKRLQRATITRNKPVLKKKIVSLKREKPLQRKVASPKPVQKAEEKRVKVQPPQYKPAERQQLMEPPMVGRYELNPLMTRMVDKELQDIMIKVWQSLPDNPTQKAEKLVVDKFRNEAGDDLRNVLGLNITKRILNIYNPLYVKVTFTKRPERDHLKAFLLKYRCIKFERVDAAAKTFTALMRNIQDFDKICSVKSIRIGSIKAYITPNYEFLKCPPNLKTNYNEKNVGDNTEPKASEEVNPNVSKTIKTENPNLNIPLKVVEKVQLEENKEVKSEAKSTPEIKEKVVETKKSPELNTTPKEIKVTPTVNEPITGTKPVIVEAVKPTKVADNSIPNKVVTTKSDESKTVSEPSKSQVQEAVNNEPKTINQTLTKAEDKTPKVENKTPAKIEDKTKIQRNVPTTKNNIISPAKVEPTKSAAAPMNSVKKFAATPTGPQDLTKKVNQVTKKNENIPKKPVTNAEKNAPKVTNKAKVPPKIQKDKGVKSKIGNKDETMRILEEGDDYDVLDDDDILALINGGVILDECSGSDVD